MKLMVDISEDVYTRLFDNGIQDNEIAVDDVCKMARALRLGTPLDDVKTEIQENINYNKKMNYQGIVAGLLLTLDILDNIGKAESEVKSNETDN